MPKIILFGDDHADSMCTKFLIRQLDILYNEGYRTFFYEDYVDASVLDKITPLIAEKQDIITRFKLFPNGDLPSLEIMNASQKCYLLEKFIPELLSIDDPNWEQKLSRPEEKNKYCQTILNQPEKFNIIQTRIKERWQFIKNRIDTVRESIKLLKKIRYLNMRLVPMDRSSTQSEYYAPEQRQNYMLNNIIQNLTDHAIVFVGVLHLIDHWITTREYTSSAYASVYIRGMVRQLKNHSTCNELSAFFCATNPFRDTQFQNAIETCPNEIVDAIKFINLARVNNLHLSLLDLETIKSPHSLFAKLRIFPAVTPTTGISLTIYIDMINAYNSLQNRLDYAKDLCGPNGALINFSGSNFTSFNIDSSKLDHATILSYLFLKTCEYDKARISQATITRDTQSKPITVQDCSGKYRLFMSPRLMPNNIPSKELPKSKKTMVTTINNSLNLFNNQPDNLVHYYLAINDLQI